MANADKKTQTSNWRERVDKQRVQTIITEEPFFAMLAVQMQITEASAYSGAPIDTMATDGKTLYVSPEFVDTLTDQELKSVLVHEIMHIGLKHVERLRDREHGLWNQACDYVVNKELSEVRYEGTTTNKYTLPSGALLDRKYDDLSADEIYQVLLKKKQQQQNGNGPGQGNSNDPGGMGGVVMPQGTKEEQDQHFEEVSLAVAQALNASAAKDPGKLPGIIQRLVELAKPQMDWRAILRRYIDSKCSTDFTWSRPARNALANGLYLPGQQPNGMSKLIVAIDTSGSVDNELLAKFMGEVHAAVTDNAIQQTVILYADTKVHREDTFEYGEQIVANAKGGGGTDFTNTFEHIKEKHPDALLTIYFTDMEASRYGTDPDHDVIWAIYGPKHSFNRLQGAAGFGEAIHLSE